MRDFSNIGLTVQSEADFQEIINKAYPQAEVIKVPEGWYSVYRDNAGMEIWIQVSPDNKCIGVNPHYKGKSKRKVCLTNRIEKEESQLDGALRACAEPTEMNDPYSGLYPFIFELPNFKTIGEIQYPCNYYMQLTAFPDEMTVYDNESDFLARRPDEEKFPTRVFITKGLFSLDGKEDPKPQEAKAFFTGTIKEFERKRNGLTNEEYYWLLIDTFGGEVDVVANLSFFDKEPLINGMVRGKFWLAGQLINAPLRSDHTIDAV